MSFGDGRSLSTSYDNRMRPTSWNVNAILGYNYSYLEHTDKVNYARNVYDGTLDRSYEYDQVGALVFAHSGAEARAAFGIDGQQWGTSDGPYSHMYDYDKQGNMTRRFGWGGEVQGGAPNGHDTDITYGYSTNKNQRDGFIYDATGNLIDDGVSYTYDAAGRQIGVDANGYVMVQWYDGDGLRVNKGDNFSTTYYLRSTVLGGQIVCELSQTGDWQRGYVYAGSDLLAIQQGGVFWQHDDPVTKSQRVTDVSGAIVATGTVEPDPWGAKTDRSSSTPFQPQTFGGYNMDANGQFDAMHRRYSATGRFLQPDPYGGSYNFSDPQSLNRYAYTKNDPVNRKDPSGLDICHADPAAPGTTVCIPTLYGGTVTVTAGSGGESITGFEGSGTEGMMIVLPSDAQTPQQLPTGHLDLSRFLELIRLGEAAAQGINEARQALQQNSLCRALFGGTSPITLLSTYVSNGLISSGTTYPVAQPGGGTQQQNFTSGDVGAVTSYAAGSYPSPMSPGVRISANPITLNQNGFYFSGNNSAGVAVNTLQGAGFQGLSLGQIRGAVIIHELLHVISRIPADAGNPTQSRANSELVRRFCFSNTPVTTTTITPLTR